MYSQETIYLHCYMQPVEAPNPQPETRYEIFVSHSDAYNMAYNCWQEFFNRSTQEADFLCHLARHQ